MRLIFVQFVHVVLNFLREIVIRDRLCTFVGGAKSYVLKANQLVDHFHGDVGVLIRVEEAVVIVAEVVDELAGVGVGDGDKMDSFKKYYVSAAFQSLRHPDFESSGDLTSCKSISLC